MSTKEYGKNDLKNQDLKNITVGNAIKETRQRRMKRVATAAATIMSAGAIFIAPAVIYFKRNEEYEITISSQTENFQSYKIALKKGATISKLKDRLNVFEGHILEGIYKDPECKIPFSETDKVAKNSHVYLKYIKEQFSISLPHSEMFTITHTAHDMNHIPWGEEFEFFISLDETCDESNISVFANTELLIPSANGWYKIPFVQENILIRIEGVTNDPIIVRSVPNQVVIKDCNGKTLQVGDRINYGDEVTLSYSLTENHEMSEFKINGVPIENNQQVVITEDLNVVYSEFDGSIITYYEIEYGMEILSYSGTEDTYSIPTYIQNKPVVSIGESAFSQHNELLRVNIPETVKTIEEYAFYECYNLMWTNFPNSLGKVGGCAFYGCYFQNIVIPSSVEYVGEDAFVYCIPNTLTIESEIVYNDMINNGSTIGNVLYGAKELKIKKSLIEDLSSDSLNNHDFFKDCVSTVFESENYYHFIYKLNSDSELTWIENIDNFKTITSYNNVTYLGTKDNLYYAAIYTEDPTQTEITINENCKIIGSYALNAPFVTSLIIPDSVERIGANAGWLTSVNTLLIGKGLRYIEEFGLCDLYSLESLIFDEECILEQFGASVISGCEVLKELTLPSVRTIEDKAFLLLGNVEKLVFKGDVGTIGSEIFMFDSTLKELVFEGNIGKIGKDAFSGLLNLEKLTIKGNISEIESRAFAECINLQEVTLAEGLTQIGVGMFYGCKSLSKIQLPSTIETIEKQAFSSCSLLFNINLPEGLKTLGDNAFSMSGISGSVTLPSNIEEIGQYLFWRCSLLKNVQIDADLETIPNSMFLYCTSLESIVLPNSVTTIGASAFSNCSNLRNITLSSNITSIGGHAFDECEKLTSVVIESGSVYNEAVGTDYSHVGRLLLYAKTIKVLASIVDNENNSNSYLNDQTKYTRTLLDDYYVYTLIE